MLYDPKWEQQVETLEPWRKALLDAADLIEQKGFWKAGLRTAPEGALCVLGAIHVAVYEVDRGLFSPAWKALAAFVGTDNITGWNDAKERTAAEVIAAMRSTAHAE